MCVLCGDSQHISARVLRGYLCVGVLFDVKNTRGIAYGFVELNICQAFFLCHRAKFAVFEYVSIHVRRPKLSKNVCVTLNV